MADNGNQTSAQTQDSDEHKKSLKRSWKSSGPVAKLTVVFAGIAALSTTIYAIVAGGQMLVMRGQLHEISRQYPEIQKSANAARSAAETADDTLKASIRNFHVEERPYVTIQDVKFDPSLEQSHEKTFVRFSFRNSGRTPALKMTFQMDGLLDKVKIVQIPRDFSAEQIIPSDQTSQGSMTLWTNPPGFAEISIGTKRLSIKGTIHYADIFREWHETTFCAIYDAKVTKLWVFCPGNDVQ